MRRCDVAVLEEYGCLGGSVGTRVHRLSSTGNTLTAHRTPHTLPFTARRPDARVLCALAAPALVVAGAHSAERGELREGVDGAAHD